MARVWVAGVVAERMRVREGEMSVFGFCIWECVGMVWSKLSFMRNNCVLVRFVVVEMGGDGLEIRVEQRRLDYNCAWEVRSAAGA
jgi:hypothetical protein